MKKSIFIFLPLLMLVLLPGCRRKNVYTYDLTQWKQVDKSVICYTEKQPIALTFTRCGGLAVNGSDIYVTGDNLLLTFSGSGILQSSTPLPGFAGCLAAAPSGLLFLGIEDYISVYDTQGNETDTWAPLGENTLLTSLAVAGNEVFAADAGNHNVVRYTETGRLIAFINPGNTERDGIGFIIPSAYFDLVPAEDNTLWIVNPGYHRLEHFSPEGKRLSYWGVSGIGIEAFSGCCNPTHIARLPGGDIVTAEKGMSRVKIYTSDGKLKCVAATPLQFTDDTIISDLAVTPGGDILVLDSSLPAIKNFQ